MAFGQKRTARNDFPGSGSGLSARINLSAISQIFNESNISNAIIFLRLDVQSPFYWILQENFYNLGWSAVEARPLRRGWFSHRERFKWCFVVLYQQRVHHSKQILPSEFTEYPRKQRMLSLSLPPPSLSTWQCIEIRRSFQSCVIYSMILLGDSYDQLN